MVPFQIKICGVTKIDEAIFAARSGASAIGLNFFQPSSRYVFPPGVPGSDPAKDDAAQIVAAIRGLSVSEKSPPVKIVGVFVNLEPERVVEIASSLGLDGIQLHGDEPASDAVEIRQKISSCQSRPAFLVRAIRTNPRTDPDSEKQTDAEAELSRIETEISRWAESGVDAVLLDAAVAGEFGGTGKSLDWHWVPKIKSPVPIILAGGLTAQNVADAIRISKVEIVDVASGVESSPGRKDSSLVQQFVESAATVLQRRSSDE